MTSLEVEVAERIKDAESNAAEGGPAASAWRKEIRFFREILKRLEGE